MNEGFTKEGLAEREPAVTARELLEEMEPLLGDYFVGDIYLAEEGIVYGLPNGEFSFKELEIPKRVLPSLAGRRAEP